MKEKIVFIGSVLLLSNISFISAEVLLIPQNDLTVLQETQGQAHQSIVNILTDKGLEPEAAIAKVNRCLHPSTDVMVANITHQFHDISSTQIEQYLANEVLFNRNCSLNNYDSLVNLVQEVKHVALDQEALQKLQKVCTLNQQLVKV